jgi:hypothetical protein
VCICNPNYAGGRRGRSPRLAPGENTRPYQKNKEKKKIKGVAQVAEHLPREFGTPYFKSHWKRERERDRNTETETTF